MPRNASPAISSLLVYVVLVLSYRKDFTIWPHVRISNHMPGHNSATWHSCVILFLKSISIRENWVRKLYLILYTVLFLPAVAHDESGYQLKIFSRSPIERQTWFDSSLCCA